MDSGGYPQICHIICVHYLLKPDGRFEVAVVYAIIVSSDTYGILTFIPLGARTIVARR